MSTRSSTTAGDDFTSPSVLNVHKRLPSFAPTACTSPARSPTNTVPSVTAGDDSPMKPPAPVSYFQRSAPVSRSSAISSPFVDPTYTAPSASAADDSTDSPASYVHFSASVAGGAVAATPVSDALPRNCGQFCDDCCADSGSAIDSHESTKARRKFTYFVFLCLRGSPVISPSPARTADSGCSGTACHGLAPAWRRRRCPCSSPRAPSFPCPPAGSRRRRPRRRGTPCRRRPASSPRRDRKSV